MQKNTAVNIEALTDSDISKSLRFDNPRSLFSPDGMIKPITDDQTISDVTTQNLSIQNYRMGKFLQKFSQTGFDGLLEVEQDNGDTLWVMDTAIDNQDFNFYLSKAEILSTITLTEVKNDQEIKTVASQYEIKEEQTYITIDGKKYFTRMNIPLNFGSGENSTMWINMGVLVLGGEVLGAAIAAVIAKLGFDTFRNALKNINDALVKTLWAVLKVVTTVSYRFVRTFIGRLIGGETILIALNAALEAAGQAWRDAWRGVNTQTLKYTLVAVIVVVSITLIIEYVLHESYQNVYLYNLTDYDIEFDFPHKDYGDYHNLPSSKVPAKTKRSGPGGVKLGEWYNGVSFRYQSDSEFHGLGYAMRIKLMKPQTQDVVKVFSCLFDVPFGADNSLYASANEHRNYPEYYSQNSGLHKTTQYSAKSDDGKHEIIVSYDYLDGKHYDPESRKDLYLYSSLVVIREIVFGHRTISSPFVAGDYIYFQGEDNKLWKVKTDGSGTLHIGGHFTKSSPFVAGDYVYFQGDDNKLWKVKTDGSTTLHIGGHFTKSSPFVAGDYVYFQGVDNKLWRQLL